jgi:hypothetical protein
MTILYLPPNMTSKIQPCDASIIRNFKAYYRRRFNRAFLQRIEHKVLEPEKVDILGAIQFVVPTWNYEVKPTTIANCRNPSFGLTTKAKGLQGCGPRGSPGVTSETPESVGECEGVSLHTPKATPKLGEGVPVGSQNFRERFEGSNLNGLLRSLYQWKALEAQMSKMGSHCSFGHLKHKL